MLKELILHDRQKSQASDINNMSLYSRQTFDAIVANGLSNMRYFTGFQVTKTGAAEITVASGHYWAGGPVFVREANTVFNLLQGGSYMPAVTKRVVAVVVNGTTQETESEQRSFRINDQGGTETQSVPTQRLRYAQVNLVPGVESPSPSKPTLDANVIPIAWVTLDTTTPGVALIEMAEDYRFPSVESLSQHIKAINTWRSQIGQTVDTILSELARIQASIPPDYLQLILAMQARLEEVEQLAKRPPSAVKTFIDNFVDESDTDTEAAGYNARVDNGLHFPGGEPTYQAVELNNPLDPKVKIVNNILLPKWSDERIRIAIEDPDDELAINQYTSQETECVQRMLSRTVLVYGDWINVGLFQILSGSSGWYSALFGGGASHASVSSEYGRFLSQLRALQLQGWQSKTFEFRRNSGEVYTFEAQFGNGGLLSGLFTSPRIRMVKKTVYNEPYWETVTKSVTISGSQVAQTFLNATNGWLTSVDLSFSQVAATGDVHVMVVETTGGTPELDRIISRGVIPVASLKTSGWVNCPIEPVFLVGGRSYAYRIVSNGNHILRTRRNNKYVSGTAFYLSDTSQWLPVQNNGDICSRLRFALYDQTRAEILMMPLQRAGGMSAITMNAAQFAPDGTAAHWEVQRAGTWYQIDEGDYEALLGSPALVNLRLVLEGTRDLMPGVDMSQTEVTLTKTESEMVHFSNSKTVTATDDVQVHYDLKGWDASEHEIDCDLILPGPTVVAPSTSVIELDPLDETSGRAIFTFEVTAATSFTVKTTGDSGESTQPYSVAQRRIHSF